MVPTQTVPCSPKRPTNKRNRENGHKNRLLLPQFTPPRRQKRVTISLVVSTKTTVSHERLLAQFPKYTDDGWSSVAELGDAKHSTRK